MVTLEGEIDDGGGSYRGVLVDLNDAGDIGGAFVASDEKAAPAIWSASGKRTRLKSGKYGGEVLALSNTGYAAGRSFETLLGLDESAPHKVHDMPRLWRDVEQIELALPSELSANADEISGRVFDVNDAGLAVGLLYINQMNPVPVVWEDGVGTMLVQSVDESGSADVVNATGMIGGTTWQSGRSMPTVWTDGALTAYDLPAELPGGADPDSAAAVARVRGLSDDGLLLVGIDVYSSDDGSTMNGAYLFDRGQATRLEPPTANLTNVTPLAISSGGAVIGIARADDAESRIFVIWEDGSGRNLSAELPDLGGLTVRTLVAINAEGQILALATDQDDARHGLLLRPSN